MPPNRTSSRDGLVVLFGLIFVIGIGAWSFFRFGSHEKESSTENAVSAEIATDFRKISIDDLKNVVLEKDDRKRMIILDIRPTSLWSDEHIIGSKSLPYDEASQSLQPTDAEKKRLWIVIAPDTTSAGRFVALLRSRGIPDEKISVFDGTYDTWKEKTGLVVHTANPLSPVDVTKVTLASPEEAKAKIEKGGQWFILDIRSAELFAAGHIAGATNIPFSDIEERRLAIPSTANILVYGASDRESFAGGVLLFDLGFFNTTTLSAGFGDWKAKNLPMRK